VDGEVVLDGGNEIGDGVEGPAPQCLSVSSLNHRSRRFSQDVGVQCRVEPGMLLKPGPDVGVFMRGVVQNQMHGQLPGHIPVDRFQNVRNLVWRCLGSHEPMTVPVRYFKDMRQTRSSVLVRQLR